ncbi:nuclear transport factor 2 family protein [soil metagenome]
MQQSGENQEVKPPVPPFNEETARQKVKAAQDAWNTRDPEKVALAYTPDSKWRNRDEFFEGREEIVAFLRRKWERELDYRLEKNLWCFTENRIAVRFEYESRDTEGQWWRSHGNELWEFDENGLMKRRDASINDYKIDESDRKYRWER